MEATASVFIDEYQDCSSSQHELIVGFKRLIPACIFGDPLQSIFEFDGVVDWFNVVEKDFPNIAKLSTPWRWGKDNANADLGEKLSCLIPSFDGAIFSREWKESL